MEIDNEAPKGNLSTKIIFILFGVASLLGWNAIMSELPFFTFMLTHD